MALEWLQTCKDCAKQFGYSDHSLNLDRREGHSRPERCPVHRRQHADEVRSIASSHFALQRRAESPSLLGSLYLGEVDHGWRDRPTSVEKTADPSAMQLGLGDEHVEEIYRALKNHQVLVIIAPTGSGKSTLIPNRLVEPLPPMPLDHFTRLGPIVVTQPRIEPTRTIPRTIGEKLLGSSVGAGYDVGFAHGAGSSLSHRDRNQPVDEYDNRSRLIFTTDGKLVNWLTNGRAGDFSIVVIDEAHERNANIDLCIGLMRAELARHNHLSLIILSATIDPTVFSDYFRGASLKVWERNFDQCEKVVGYERHFWTAVAPPRENEMSRAVADKILEILSSSSDGGIIAFLPGEGEIRNAIEMLTPALKDHPEAIVFPLYTKLSEAAKRLALAPLAPRTGKDGKAKPCRRILIATNYAETSLTIADLTYVVDSGLINQGNWDSNSQRKTLSIRKHSQFGCRQRWGRVGRVSPGIVHALYTEGDFEDRPVQTPPGIEREPLDQFLLDARVAGLPRPDTYPWLASPPEVELRRVEHGFRSRGVVDEGGNLTPHGLELWAISRQIGGLIDTADENSTGRTLDVAQLLLLADRFACLVEAITAVLLMPRMGEDICTRFGLLQWDRRWSLKSKSHAQAVHDALRVGCRDDLDFAAKIYRLYLIARKDPASPYWDYLNKEAFEQVEFHRDAILDRFLGDKAERERREVDFGQWERLRVLLPAAWPDAAVRIQPGIPVRFETVNAAQVSSGDVSSRCCVPYASAAPGLVCLSRPARRLTEGSVVDVRVANFLVTPAELLASADISELACRIGALRTTFNSQAHVVRIMADRLAPIGSRVRVNRSGDGFVIVRREEDPPRHEFTFDGPSKETDEDEADEDSEEGDVDRGDPPPLGAIASEGLDLPVIKMGARTEEPALLDRPQLPRLSARWLVGAKPRLTAVVLAWEENEGKPRAVLANVGANAEPRLSQPVNPVGASIAVRLLTPIMDPPGRRKPERLAGFVCEAEGESRLMVAVADLGLDHDNPALRELQRSVIHMTVIGNDSISGQPMLSRLAEVEANRVALVNEGEADAIVLDAFEDDRRQLRVRMAVRSARSIMHPLQQPLNGPGAVWPEFLPDITPGSIVRVSVVWRPSRKEPFRVKLDRELAAGAHPNLEGADLAFEGKDLLVPVRLSYADYVTLAALFPASQRELRRALDVTNQLSCRIIDSASTLEAQHEGEHLMRGRVDEAIVSNTWREELANFRGELNAGTLVPGLSKRGRNALFYLCNQLYDECKALSKSRPRR